MLCDELLHLSDDQLSQFLRRPSDAPGGLNSAAPSVVPAAEVWTGTGCVSVARVHSQIRMGERNSVTDTVHSQILLLRLERFAVFFWFSV